MYFEDFSAKFLLLEFHQNLELYFNPIQDGAGRGGGGGGGQGQKGPPYQFFLCNFYKPKLSNF